MRDHAGFRMDSAGLARTGSQRVRSKVISNPAEVVLNIPDRDTHPHISKLE